MLLLGLVLGALLGAAVTFLVLRERMRSALTQNRAGEDSADRLLRLADERHERDEQEEQPGRRGASAPTGPAPGATPTRRSARPSCSAPSRR